MTTVLRASVSLLIGTFIFIGWPLLAWGIGGIQDFFANPARLGYVAVTIPIYVAIVVIMPDAGRKRGHAKMIVGRQRVALALIQILSLSLVVVAPYCDRRGILSVGDAQALRYTGLALYVLGLVGIHWAEAALGKQFSYQVSLNEGHNLITHGPYRYFRHPRYLSILVFSTGYALIFHSGIALAVVMGIALVLAWRAHDEDALLHQEFGSQWETYARKTWGLIPFLR